MRAKCYLCSHWNDKLKEFEYTMAEKTEWEPPPGYDPRLRQFKCPACGGVFYHILTPGQLTKVTNG